MTSKKKTVKKGASKKAAELILEKGDRVRRKDGRDFFGGVMVGVVDSELYDTPHGQQVYVRTLHAGFGNSGTEYVAELEKIEDYIISVKEFFHEMHYWLMDQKIKAKSDGNEKVMDAYGLVAKKMAKLIAHVGF